jgi:threonine synthase
VGVAVPVPPRQDAVVAAIRVSGGGMAVVSEEEIDAARAELARRGWYVEPTAAVAVAGLRRLPLQSGAGVVVIPLTGSGLKA